MRTCACACACKHENVVKACQLHECMSVQLQVTDASAFATCGPPAIKQLAFDEGAAAQHGFTPAGMPYLEVSPQSMPATALLASPQGQYSTPSAIPQYLTPQF